MVGGYRHTATAKNNADATGPKPSGSLAFLFGSGLSLAAGFPSTVGITEQVLSGAGVIRHTDGRYYICGASGPAGLPGYVDCITQFLNIVVPLIAGYYDDIRTTNYEDIYYCIAQVRDSETREYDNPVVARFASELRELCKDVLTNTVAHHGKSWEFLDMTVEACNYIHDMVVAMLSPDAKHNAYLSFLKDAQGECERLYIFSLNHDLLVEKYLHEVGISYTDGFGDPEHGVRYWDQGGYDTEDKRVNLFKLHGSIDWYRLRPDAGTWYDERYGIPLAQDPWHTEDSGGCLQMPLTGRPEVLLGTFNKILRYNDEIFFDVHCQFVKALRATTRLVICGYGFGDKAINSQIIRWLYSSAKNKLIVVHPDPKRVSGSARGAVGRRWDEWQDDGALITLAKGAEELTWADLSPYSG